MKYLLILEYDIIPEKCSNCSRADKEFIYINNLKDLYYKIASLSKNNGYKIYGIYKEINRISLDKNLNIKECEE